MAVRVQIDNAVLRFTSIASTSCAILQQMAGVVVLAAPCCCLSKVIAWFRAGGGGLEVDPLGGVGGGERISLRNINAR